MVLRSCLVALFLSVAGCAVQTGGEDPGSNAGAEAATPEASDSGNRQVKAFTSEADKAALLKSLGGSGMHAEMKKGGSTCTTYDEVDFFIQTGIWSTYGGTVCE